jgi:predicted nucleic-acid-binding Zn-ribbon protein
MKSGICPKCEKNDVYRIKDAGAIQVKFMQYAELNIYICSNCGYVETFVKDKKDLKFIAEKYQKVN